MFWDISFPGHSLYSIHIWFIIRSIAYTSSILGRFQVRTVLSNVSRIEEVVVSDMTADGMEDLIVTMDNGTAGGKDIVALNGIGFQVLWIHTVSAGTTLK